MTIESSASCLLATIAAAATVTLSACASDDATVVDRTSEADPPVDGAPVNMAPDVETPPPAYVISTRVETPDSQSSYVVVTDSLAAGSNADLETALEFEGSAVAVGRPNAGAVYVTSSEDGTMTEVTIDANGSPQPRRVVSFAALGISETSGGNVNAFLTPNKAYHVNQDSLDVVVWNPAAMTVTSSFPTGLTVDEGFVTRIFLQQPIVTNDRLLLVSYQANEDNITEGITTLTVIDTVNDTVIAQETDSRCSAMVAFVTDSDGSRYFTSSTLHASNYFVLPDLVPHPPCMLRLRAGETQFDPEWSRVLTTDLGTSIWTGVAPGREGHVLVQGIGEDHSAVQEAVEPFEVLLARPWNWYEVNPAAAAQPLVTTLTAPITFSAVPVDDHYYLTAWDSVSDTSTLVDTTAAAGPRPEIAVRGFVFNVLRVR